MRVFFELARPFTLLPPALGMISGAVAAWGALPDKDALPLRALLMMACCASMAAALNAASNVLNQVYDIHLDRVNKPERPLPRAALSMSRAKLYAGIWYGLAALLAWPLGPSGVHDVFWIVLLTAVLTWAYSAPPFRCRNSWWLASLVIAIPRGLLLKVAGWGTVADVASDREPWVLGGIFFLFVLGGAGIKDFEDMEGDRLGGSSSLPLRFGRVAAARIMGVALVLPWLLLALAPWINWRGSALLSLNPAVAMVVGVALAALGLRAAHALLNMARGENDKVRARAAWRMLYLQMMAAQVLTAAAYWWAWGT